jgi:succinylglutamate desuccinylase
MLIKTLTPVDLGEVKDFFRLSTLAEAEALWLAGSALYQQSCDFLLAHPARRAGLHGDEVAMEFLDDVLRDYMKGQPPAAWEDVMHAACSASIAGAPWANPFMPEEEKC